jgi:hypothetical protein
MEFFLTFARGNLELDPNRAALPLHMRPSLRRFEVGRQCIWGRSGGELSFALERVSRGVYLEISPRGAGDAALLQRVCQFMRQQPPARLSVRCILPSRKYHVLADRVCVCSYRPGGCLRLRVCMNSYSAEVVAEA